MTRPKRQIKCALCGKTILRKKGQQKQHTIVEIIDGTNLTFDTNDCLLMFKKLRSVYGSDFI
jgi:hypothetical protein